MNLLNEYTRYTRRTDRPAASRFKNIVIELTERCNNDCIHCCINLPADDLKAKKREMSTGQIKAILAEAVELGCLTVRFTGGEPLLRTDFEELYLYARHMGLKVQIYSNARLITTHLAALFAQIPPLAPIEITVYGMHTDSYDAVSRKPGSYAQFRSGINNLLKHKVPFVVKGALLPSNLDEVDQFESWAASLPWMEKPPGYVLFFDLRYRRDDANKNRLISEIRLAPEDGINILSRDWERYSKDRQRFARHHMGPAGDKLFTCGAGNSLYIDAYGRALPCVALRSPDLTVSVWNNGHLTLQKAVDSFSSLADLKAANPEYLKRCAICNLKGLCNQCPAKSWAENGSLDSPIEYFCDVAHAHARRLGWLGDNEFGWQIGFDKTQFSLQKGI